MSLNLFFGLILGLLLGMYTYFAPNYSAQQEKREIPKIELLSFTLYEISHKGIDNILVGEEAKKFDDRYEVTSGKFGDNTKRLFQSIRSDAITYKDHLITLNGNVHYVRQDGLEFRSHEGRYDTKASIASTEGTFVITQDGNRVEGQKLFFDTHKDTVSADRIRGSYNLR